MARERSGELVQGTLDMLILKTLAHRTLHGYAIALAIHQRSDEVLRVEEGSLYPALHRLELAGFLASEWKISDARRRAKFYRITPAGRKHLAAESQNWVRLAGGIAKIMGTA
ncbi:MAG: PadR family transcriptional regulator [Bryobacteraceae bacterium]